MNLKFRLALMNFLEFAVWGAYLTCMGNYLGTAGLGSQISWFYAIQGIVSIFMPTIMGIVADKYIQPQRLLGISHMIAGAAMLCCWYMGASAGFGNELPNKGAFIAMYTLSVAFFMPTIALANTTAFTILKNNGLDTVKDFPPIRVLGTVGFIATMWFVNCAVWEEGSFSFTLAENAHKFQYTHMQFFVSGFLSLVLLVYCFVALPECKLEKKPATSLAESFGLNAFKLFKSRQMALCRSFHYEFQRFGRCGCRNIVCCQQCHPAHLHLTGQRGPLHPANTFLPETLRHQGRHAHVYVCLGVPLWLLRHRQSRHARRFAVHPVVYRLRCGFRLLQCLWRHLRRPSVRAFRESLCTGSLHADDQRYWRHHRYVGRRRDCEPLLHLAGGLPCRRLADVLVHLCRVCIGCRHHFRTRFPS